MNSFELIRKLTSVPAVSGSEDSIYAVLKDILSEYGDVKTDAMNNIFCSFGKGRHFLLDAHTDEIGFAVTSITDDGFLKLGACGGIDNRMLLGYEVSVWGKSEARGVISTLPPHLQRSEDEKKVPDISEVSVDIGMSREEAEKILSPGDKVTFRRKFTTLLGNKISSNCLDNRAGVAAILLTLDKLKNLPVKITVMLSSQEELGTRGAKTGSFGKGIDEALSVDVSFGYTPGCKKEECAELGKGPMIGISPVLDKKISNLLINTARKNNIPFQTEVMSGKTSTNADVISVSESGIKCGLISIPLKYMHSPVEVVDIQDIENVSRLITAYIKERAGAENA